MKHTNHAWTIATVTTLIFTALVLAYTAPSSDNVDLTGQGGYTAPANTDVPLSAGEPEGVTCHFTTDTTITSSRDCTGKQVNITQGAKLTLQAELTADCVHVKTDTGAEQLIVDSNNGGRLKTLPATC